MNGLAAFNFALDRADLIIVEKSRGPGTIVQ